MNWKATDNQELIRAILSLENETEARLFLRDLMTEGEIEEFGKRLRTAELLTNKVSYLDIKAQTGLSSTTIARVAKWLNGKAGGYRSVIAKLHHHDTLLREETGRV